jgi:hypothetical protein
MPRRKKVVMEVPAALEETVRRLVNLEERNERMAKGEEPLNWRSLSGELEAAMRDGEAQVARRWLQSYDERRKAITVDGKEYRRVGRHEGTYYTKAGSVTVMRTLYRDAAVRNDKTVDAISLKLGCIEDGWLPEAAEAMAYLLQNSPGTEAEKLAKKMGRLPYSASSFKRVGTAVGELFEAQRADVEDALIAESVIPDKVRSLTVSLDRVALPMEEEVPRKAGRPKKDAPKKSIVRVFHMAWVGTVTLTDAEGEAVHTIRYGEVPTKKPETPEKLLESMVGDVSALLTKRPRLKVMIVSDGAQDVVELLDEHFTEKALGAAVMRLVDFWHVIEKLGKAAAVIFGGEGGKTRLGQWKLRLLNSRHARGQILRELHDSGREWVRVGEKSCPVHEAITYLTNQADRMNYVDARAAGLAIGSGNVEASCKSLVQLRMCRSGARWKPEGAQAMLSMRALAVSDRWDRALDLTLEPLHHDVRAAG